MKPYEQFVGKLLKAVGASRGKDPLAATRVIQEALRSAGLLGQGAPSAPSTPSTPPEQDNAAAFVDLNTAPVWTHGRHAPGRAREGGNAGAPGRFTSASFSGPAGTRAYRLYVPERQPDGPRALVVMLHGCQQDASDFAAGTGMNALAERHGCLVLYPEQARSANGSNCWNWFEAPHQQRDEGEPSLIAGMTRAVMREHGVDPGRVFVAGLSAGGAMAAILGATHPDLYVAVGVHSGLAAGSAHDLMSGLNAMKGARHGHKRRGGAHRPLPAIVFHGDQDAVVHPSNGEAVVRQFAAASGLREVEERGRSGSGRDFTRTTMLDADGRAVLENWTVHGAGHAWFGGSAAGSYTDPGGPDASAEMLRFFLAQPQR